MGSFCSEPTFAFSSPKVWARRQWGKNRNSSWGLASVLRTDQEPVGYFEQWPPEIGQPLCPGTFACGVWLEKIQIDFIPKTDGAIHGPKQVLHAFMVLAMMWLFGYTYPIFKKLKIYLSSCRVSAPLHRSALGWGARASPACGGCKSWGMGKGWSANHMDHVYTIYVYIYIYTHYLYNICIYIYIIYTIYIYIHIYILYACKCKCRGIGICICMHPSTVNIYIYIHLVLTCLKNHWTHICKYVM